ncbi:MAG: oligoendopeptidase F [Clostridia bacterium]|nr:oligoendopeptidase F [Clostridia bacterium]
MAKNRKAGSPTQTELPDRRRIPKKYRWRLEDLYSTAGAWERDFKKAEKLIQEFPRLQGKIKESAAGLKEVLKSRDQLDQLLERLYVYAHLQLDQDTTNSKSQALSQRIISLATEASTAQSFLVPELVSLEPERLEQYFQDEPELELYRHDIQETVRLREHILPPEQEKLLAGMGEIAAGPGQVFRMLNDADLKLPRIHDQEGREVQLTKGNYQQFIRRRERKVREEAFKALHQAYSDQINTLSTLYATSVKKDIYFARVRHYPSVLAAALDGDNIPLEVYDRLVEVVRKNLPLLHRYLELRRRMLDLPVLAPYDLYVPLVEPPEEKYTYEEACEIVARGLTPLGDDYVEELRRGMTGGWVDVMETRGKASGAYSTGAYPVHPYVLLNFQGDLDSVFTLAHEMGHAMHTFYSFAHQPYVYSGYSIFVAEVASTVNESLLMQHLLAQTKEEMQAQGDKTSQLRHRRLYLLNHYLEEFRATVFRQTMFAEFERLAHQEAERGGALTVDWLKQTYHQLNADYFGPQVQIDPLLDVEWARIPHFYSAFYVYKYATGFSAATALCQQILKEGDPARERYLKFLSLGSSNTPIELLKVAGVDMTRPEPVQEALDFFGQILQEMEELVQK